MSRAPPPLKRKMTASRTIHGEASVVDSSACAEWQTECRRGTDRSGTSIGVRPKSSIGQESDALVDLIESVGLHAWQNELN